LGDLFSSLKISGSGLSVFRRKMNIAAENLANVETTQTENGGPYQRKTLKVTAKNVPTTFSRVLNSTRVELANTQKAHISGRSVPRYNGTNVFHANAEASVDPNQNLRMVYDPSHPDADPEGFVAMPDIDPLTEMVNMMTAARGYEANISSIQTMKDMVSKALDI